MLPDIKVFIPKSVYVLTGRFLNALCDRILRQTPLEGNGIDLEETKDGLIPHARAGAIVAAADEMTYGFQVSWKDADEVTVAAGIVAGTLWGSPDWTDPVPSDWLDEIVSPQTDLVVADGDSIWLEILNPKADSNRTGPLPTDGATAKSVTPGAGGGGGQGGGGGGGGDAGEDGTAGTAGATGAAGGAGGDAAGVGGQSPGEGDGTEGYGGDGGAGGTGGAGETVLFTHYTILKLRTRRYTTFSVSLTASASKPSVASTNIAIRLATVSGGVITQHHAGTYHQTLPTSTFIV